MDNLIKAIKRDPKVQHDLNIILDHYMSLPYDFQSKIGYNCLIHVVILKKLIKIMSLIISEIDFI